MSQSQTTFAQGRYSKRKRAQVNYYSSDSEEDEFEVEGNSEDDYGIPQPKKRKSSTSTKTEKEETPFPFLKLPAEIRNIIYGLCLTDPSGINFVATIKKKRRTVERVPRSRVNQYGSGYTYGAAGLDSDDSPPALVPSLLAVNKQINSEARSFLYDHEFTMADPTALHSFMINLGPRAATYIKNITLIGWARSRGTFKAYNHAGFAMLSWATNLKRLRFDASMGYHHTGKWAAHQFYRDGFSWLETVGILKGRVDAAVDLLEIGEGVFSRRSWNYTESKENPHNEKVEDFCNELRKLLGAHQSRVLARPAKRATKQAAASGEASSEEEISNESNLDEADSDNFIAEGFIVDSDEEKDDGENGEGEVGTGE